MCGNTSGINACAYITHTFCIEQSSVLFITIRVYIKYNNSHQRHRWTERLAAQKYQRRSIINHALLHDSPLSSQIVCDQTAMIILRTRHEAPEPFLIHRVVQLKHEFDHSASYIRVRV